MTTTAWDKLGVWVLRPRVFIVFALLQALLILFVDKPLAEFLNAQHLAQHFPWLLELTDLGKSEWYLVGLLLLALVYRWLPTHTHSRLTSNGASGTIFLAFFFDSFDHSFGDNRAINRKSVG